MTEFSPPKALLAQNEEKTMDMRIAAWSHHDHIKPILIRMFTAAAKHAVELRAQRIDEIEAVGVKKVWCQFITLNDDTELNLASLLHFPLYRAELPVEQTGLPEDQRLARQYAVDLRIGGQRLGYGTDDPLNLSRQYSYEDGKYYGRTIFNTVAQKEVVPETIKITESIKTGFGTIDDLNTRYGGAAEITSADNYYLKTQTWVPNLSKFGHPEVELPKKTDISFAYDSHDNERGGIDKYGSMGKDKIACARRLARLTELTSRFLDLSAETTELEMEPLRTIAAE